MLNNAVKWKREYYFKSSPYPKNIEIVIASLCYSSMLSLGALLFLSQHTLTHSVQLKWANAIQVA